MRSTLLWLRLWRALNPARRRWVPRSLWWQLRPDIPLVAGHTGDVDGAVAFRFRNGDTVGLNTDSDWKAAESVDISWATTELDTTRRVRIEVEEWKSVAETFTPEWQYSKNSGTWTNITTTSSNIKAVASAQYNEGDATSTSLITGNSKTHVNGEGTEDGASGSQTLNNQSSEYELAYQIVSTDVAATDTIDLRVRPNGAAAETYTDPARITITAPPATTAQAAFRIRNSDTETLDAAFDAGDPAENANATLNLEVPFRIRFQIEETNGGTFSATGLELEYRIDTTGTGSSYGAWTLVPGNTQNWESASSFGQVEGLESQQFVQGANCGTSRLTTSAETFKANEGEGRSYTPDAHQAVTLTNQYLEAEWCLVVHKLYADGSNNTPDGSLIQFRVREDDATALDGYDNTPTITINDPAGLIGGTTPEAPDKAIGVDGFNKSGPWKDSNGNLYALVETSSGGSQNALMMLKSTDGGDTWNTQDVANNPTQGDAEAISVELNEAGDTLLINHYSSNLDLHEFRMSNHATIPSRDTWGTTDTEIVNTVGGTEQACTLSRFGATKGTPDDDLISAFTYNTDDIGYRRRVGGSWDGTTTALWNVTSVAHHGVSSVVGSSGETHFVAVDATNGNLNGKTIDASGNMTDLLGTTVDATAAGTVIDTNVGTTTDERMNIAALIFFNDGSDKLFVAWRDATDGDLESVVVTLGTSVGSVSTTAVNDTGNIAHNHGASLQPVASIARDDATGDFHAVFAAESTRGGDTNVSYDKSTDDGDNWGTDTTPTLRSPLSRINWIHASIFTHSAGNGGKTVLGFWYDDVAADEFPTALTGEDAAGEGTGFVWYDEVELISFVDGAGSANNASQTSAVGSTLKEGAASADQAVDSTSNGFADRLAASSANQAATATATTFVNRDAASSANQAATATAAGEVIAGGAAGSANNASTATATGAVFPIDWGTFNYFDGTELTPAAPGFDVGTGDYFQASELAVVYPLPITTVAGPGLVDSAASANNAVQAAATAVVEKTGAASADQAVQATVSAVVERLAAASADQAVDASATAVVGRFGSVSADQAVQTSATAVLDRTGVASANNSESATAVSFVERRAAGSADNASTVTAAGQVFGLQEGAGSADNASTAAGSAFVDRAAAGSADSASTATGTGSTAALEEGAGSADNAVQATAVALVERTGAASGDAAVDAAAVAVVERLGAGSADNANTATGSASTAALEEGAGSANNAVDASATAVVERLGSASGDQAVDASATAVRQTTGQGSADQSVQATGETAVRFSAAGSANNASDVTAQGAISGVEEGAGSAANAATATGQASVFAAGAATAANAVDAVAVSVRGRHGQASGDAATVAAGSGFRTALGSASADVAVEGTAAASATLAGGSSAPNAVTASAAAELVGALTGQGSANQASAASGSAAVTRSGSGSADSSTLGSADALVDIPGAGSANSASDASASGVSGAIVSAQGSASQASSASALPVVVRLGSGTSSIAVATSATGLKTLFGAAIAANAEQTVGAGFRWANGAGSADNAETASGTVFLVGDVPGEGTANMAAYATADGFSSEAITAIGGTRVYGDLDRQYDYNTRQYDNVTRSYQSPTESDSIAEGEPEFVS